MADIENVSRRNGGKGLAPVAQERARQRSLRKGGRGGGRASLGEGRRVKQRTVEKWLPPDAGRRNIKGNRLLVREVKNRPSPGHTRIAFIHLLYVLYHWSVIPFWRVQRLPHRVAARDTHTRDYANSAYQRPNRVTWLYTFGILRPSHLFILVFILCIFATRRGRLMSLISLCDGILCIIYDIYRRQCCVAKSHTVASLDVKHMDRIGRINFS